LFLLFTFTFLFLSFFMGASKYAPIFRLLPFAICLLPFAFFDGCNKLRLYRIILIFYFTAVRIEIRTY